MKTSKFAATILLIMIPMMIIMLVGMWMITRPAPVPQTYYPPQETVPTTPPTGTGQCFGGLQTKISAGGKEIITGTGVNINVELWTADNVEETGETNANAAVTSISTTYPVQTSGYAMIGNDNYQSTTDRGTEYYYYKKPFTVGCAPVTLGLVPLYAEGTPTWTCYDDGVAETTCNITVGSSVVDTTELKITVSSNAYLGMTMAGDSMPIKYPLGVCFNVTTLADWDKIYPSPYASSYSDSALGITNGKFNEPDFIGGNNTLGSCYVLDTKALRDPAGEGLARYYRFWVIFDPDGSGVTVADTTFVWLVDLCWSKDDNMQWRLGFGDASEQGGDSDCGMDTVANLHTIYHA